MTTIPTAPITPARRRRTLRSLAVVLSAAAATVAAVGAGFAPTSAKADPSETRIPVGSSQLLQSEDLSSVGLALDTGNVLLRQDGHFSSCLGEVNSWTQVLTGSPAPITAAWTRRGHPDQALHESIVQARDQTQARQFATTLVERGIKDCQRPVHDVRYGRITTTPVGSGTASWALSYRGSSTAPDGGVVAIRNGSKVGFVQLSGTDGPTRQTVASVAKLATERLQSP